MLTGLNTIQMHDTNMPVPEILYVTFLYFRHAAATASVQEQNSVTDHCQMTSNQSIHKGHKLIK